MVKLNQIITSFENRNHFGINKQKEGLSYVGFVTNSGRVPGEHFVKILWNL